jgi:hypothetical protein
MGYLTKVQVIERANKTPASAFHLPGPAGAGHGICKRRRNRLGHRRSRHSRNSARSEKRKHTAERKAWKVNSRCCSNCLPPERALKQEHLRQVPMLNKSENRVFSRSTENNILVANECRTTDCGRPSGARDLGLCGEVGFDWLHQAHTSSGGLGRKTFIESSAVDQPLGLRL